MVWNVKVHANTIFKSAVCKTVQSRHRVSEINRIVIIYVARERWGQENNIIKHNTEKAK